MVNHINVSMEFLTSRDLSSVEKILFLILKSHCKGGSDMCYPSIRKDLTRELNVTARTVIRTLQSLQEKGYIVIDNRVGEYGGTETNRYTLLKECGGIN